MVRTIVIAALLAAAAAQAPEPVMPHHKPGLWQDEIVKAGKTTSMQQCFDETSEAQLDKIDRDKCSDRHTVHNADGSWTTSATCKIFLFIERSERSEISGDFQSRLKIVSYKLPDNTLEATTTTKWLGPCKPGQKGGDIILSTGTTINLLDVLGH
ncbi:MAG: DUF3617 family protein [Rhizomicrobium sp.]